MNLFPSPGLWVVVSIIAIAAIVVTINLRRSESWGFKDLVKNPNEYLHKLVPSDEDTQRALRKAESWNAQELSAAVRSFVLDVSTSREAHLDKNVLKSLGEKTQSAVLSLLNDPQLRLRLVQPNEADMFRETPFKRACTLLGETPPLEAIITVAPFLDDTEASIRKEAALVLGRTGNPEAAPYLRRALRDEDEYVRSYALMGLQHAERNKRLLPECASSLFADVERMFTDGKTDDKAASVLLMFDRERAVTFLLSDAVFSPESPVLHDVLEALTASEIRVPRDKLLGVVDALRNREMKYPQSYVLREALLALGKHQLPEDRALFDSLLSASDEEVAEGAAYGLLNSHGLGDFEIRIWDKEEKSGYDSLTVPQRHYSAIFMCDAEINNGGLSQYFFNSSGDQWEDAVAGFEAMGFRERAGILREAVALFGKAGPSRDRETRMDQLSRIFRKNDQIFDGMESRYYASKEALKVKGALYVLRNPTAFE